MKLLVIGATGLIGNTFLNFIRSKPTIQVVALVRREIPDLQQSTKIRQEIIDFERLQDYKDLMVGEVLICALGTTIKKAGTQEKFRHVDYELPMTIANYSVQNGMKDLILISAIGADPNSRIFYSRVKGELERDIRKLPLRSIHILRPSLLLGDRQEFRFGEEIGKLLLKPFRMFIPWKYRPVEVSVIAEKIYQISQNPQQGVYVYEGRKIFLP